MSDSIPGEVAFREAELSEWGWEERGDKKRKKDEGADEWVPMSWYVMWHGGP